MLDLQRSMTYSVVCWCVVMSRDRWLYRGFEVIEIRQLSSRSALDIMSSVC